MPLPGTMGAPVFGGADVTKFIEAYESLSSRTGTDPAAEDVIATFPYYCSETIQETIKMMNGYLRKDWEQLKEELKDAFRHADSRVYMYTRSYLERLCKEQRERGNVGLKAFILAYDNISRIMIDKGALAEYSQVEMLLGALPRNLRAKAVMKLELDPRDPSTFKYDKTPKACPQQMCDRRCPRPPGFGRSTYGAGSLSLFSPSWSSAPTDASSDKPSGNP